MKIDKALAIAAITTTLATGGLVDATPDAAQAKPKDCASRYRDLAYAQYMSAQWGQYWVDLVDDGSPQPDTDRAYNNWAVYDQAASFEQEGITTHCSA